jgi:hypothetical protein
MKIDHMVQIIFIKLHYFSQKVTLLFFGHTLSIRRRIYIPWRVQLSVDIA